MAIQPNLVVGVSGLILAALTGAYIFQNWETLTQLEHYEARFDSHSGSFETRSLTVPPNSERRIAFEVRSPNVTGFRADVTWDDPVLGAPEITITILDPLNVSRGSTTHRGGSSGIHFDIEVFPKADVPRGTHAFDARGDPRSAFDAKWPGHPAGTGNWTLVILARTPSGPPSPTSVLADASFETYTGSFERRPELVK